MVGFICLPIFTQAQLKNIVSQSPNAAELGKYGQFPVELSSGIPQIGIPLYQIASSKLSLNISLSYHASGILVNQKATSVGLGWALNAGGVITRTVRGIPDDNINAGYLKGYEGTDFPLRSELTNNSYKDYLFAKEVLQGIKDNQPVIFFYNFNVHSGKFSFGQNREPVTYPLDDIKIKLSTAKIDITDEIGNQYIFANGETAQHTAGDGLYYDYTVSWYLSEIISADGKDKITLEYSSPISLGSEIANWSETIGARPVCNACGTMEPYISYNLVQGANFTTSVVSSQAIYLTSIKYVHGKVDFKYAQDRLDGGDSGWRLSKIDIYNASAMTGDYQLLKSFQIGNNYYFSSVQPRMKLNNLDELDKQGNVIKTHSFAYNSNSLPARNSYAQDHWGFYNGKDANVNLIPAGGTTTFGTMLGTLQFSVSNANRNTDQTRIQNGILTKITYPTKGYTDFTYSTPYVSSNQIVSVEKSIGFPANDLQSRDFPSTSNMYYPNANPNASIYVKFELIL